MGAGEEARNVAHETPRSVPPRVDLRRPDRVVGLAARARPLDGGVIDADDPQVTAGEIVGHRTALSRLRLIVSPPSGQRRQRLRSHSNLISIAAISQFTLSVT